MKSPFKLFVVIATIIIFLWVSNLLVLNWVYDKSVDRGQIGDSFGTVNTLFSGLAFAALLVTIWMQRDELQLQRTELALQREEMAKSREQVETQVRTQRATLMATIAQAKIMAMEADIRATEAKITAATADRAKQAAANLSEDIRDTANRINSVVASVEGRILGLDEAIDLGSPSII